MIQEKKTKKRYLELLVAVVLVGVIILMPLINDGYNMLCLNLTLIYALCALSISIMLGMGGMMTFASVSMMGVGGYFAANMTTGRLGVVWPTSLVLILSPLFTALVAFVFGLILLRLKGTYFTFATIGLVQVSFSFYSMYKPLFGGYDGITGVPNLSIFGYSPEGYSEWFYILAFVLIIAALAIERVRRSKLGRSLAAIRDNEVAAKTLGINVYMTKVIAFTIAGALAGVAGALYAMHTKYISADMFTFKVGVRYIIMAMLGGVNNTIGVIMGAILVGMLPEWLRFLRNYMNLIYGIGIILLMIFMPMGLTGLIESWQDKRRKKRRHTLPSEEKEV